MARFGCHRAHDLLRFLERKTEWRLSTGETGDCSQLRLGMLDWFGQLVFPTTTGGLRAFSELSLDSQACGVAVFKSIARTSEAITNLHHPIPVFFFPNLTVAQSTYQTYYRMWHRNQRSCPFKVTQRGTVRMVCASTSQKELVVLAVQNMKSTNT
jgi:hypothetical protein